MTNWVADHLGHLTREGPGWAVRAGALRPVEVHPWPWLVRPGDGPVRSFSAWRRALKI